jgi:hypothetical protein
MLLRGIVEDRFYSQINTWIDRNFGAAVSMLASSILWLIWMAVFGSVLWSVWRLARHQHVVDGVAAAHAVHPSAVPIANERIIAHPRQLSPYEAEQKLRVIDSALLILRDEFPPALQRARQLESNGWNAFKHKDLYPAYNVDLAHCRDMLVHAANSIESVRQRNPEYRDVSDALQQPSHGISLEAAMSNYATTYGYMATNLKDGASNDAFEYALAPRRVELRQKLDLFTNWRMQAERQMIEIRRLVSP